MNMEKQKVMPSKEEQSPDRAVLRTFDQRAAPERRAALADELRTLRRERAVGTHSSQEEIFTVEQAMEQHSASPAEAAEELETISEETQTRQASAVSDITDIFRLKQLRAATGIVERKEGDLAADIQRNEATLATLDALAADRLTLATARARLAEYYKTVGEEFEAFEAEAVGRDIGALMQKHEAFFFHGITTDTGDVQQQNGVIHANVPAKDRLKLLLAVAPTISTSSLKDRLNKVE